jgi:hypothetical protein
MIAKANLVLGGTSYQFEFDEKEDKEALNKAIVLANPPTYCTVCKKEDLKPNFHLTSNRDKENNIYINIKHNPCGAKARLGEHKAGGYFWHRDFEKYVAKVKTEAEGGEQ